MKEVFVVTKQVSIDTSIIGVTLDASSARDLCRKDYKGSKKDLPVVYTFSCFEISKIYTHTTKISYDYVPNGGGAWSEIKVQRYFDPEEIESEIWNNG